jgi:chemotaxis protein methyltransferase CheR
MELTDTTYEMLRGQIHRLCGLTLLDDRRYLIRDRLGKLIQQHALADFEDLARQLHEGRDRLLEDAVVESILTGETSFFRDPHVFAALARDILPPLIRPGAAPLRILSAGVSTGQEAYSLAMLADEQCPRGGHSARGGFSILATDISARALNVAREGRYHRRELLRGLDSGRTLKYFDVEGEFFKVKELIRQPIEFAEANFTDPLPFRGPFDLISCRNVMIYFDDTLRQALCRQFHQLLKPGGWLVIGAAENLYGLSTKFESISLAGNVFCYRRKD